MRAQPSPAGLNSFTVARKKDDKTRSAARQTCEVDEGKKSARRRARLRRRALRLARQFKTDLARLKSFMRSSRPMVPPFIFIVTPLKSPLSASSLQPLDFQNAAAVRKAIPIVA